jgi:hypothetical protein
MAGAPNFERLFMDPMTMPPGMGEPDADNVPGAEVQIPLSALAQPDDTEKMVQPAEGDSVSFTVDATISRIVGGVAFVKPSAVNGKPLSEMAGPENPDDAMAAEGDALRGELMQGGGL